MHFYKNLSIHNLKSHKKYYEAFLKGFPYLTQIKNLVIHLHESFDRQTKHRDFMISMFSYAKNMEIEMDFTLEIYNSDGIPFDLS